MKISTRKSEESKPEEIKQWIVNEMVKEFHLPKNEIDLERPFTDYGLGSLQAVQFSGELEKHLGKRISPTIFLQHDNINKIVSHLSGARPAKKKQIKSKKSGKQKLKLKAESYDIKAFPEIIAAQAYRKKVEQASGTQLFFRINEGVASSVTMIDGREYINFSSYNYLNMSGDQEISAAAISAIRQYGTSVSGSRLVGGEKQLHVELEKEICELIGVDACIVYNSGHATNVSTIGQLMKKNDLIVLDKLSHNSLVQGALLSGATMKFFQHNDSKSLEMILSESRAFHDRVLIVTEGIFSMDGDIPPVPEFIRLKRKYGALLYIDEAHSLGVLGKTGRGIREYFNLNPRDVDLWMGTLSKSLAACGGYVAGQKELIDYLKMSSPGFVYSCGLSPADTAAALASIRKLKADPSSVAILQRRAAYFLSLLKKGHVDTGLNDNTPIIPIIVGDSAKALKLCAALRKRGLYLQALFYPAVEEGTARLRAFITASHTEQQLKVAAEQIIDELGKLENKKRTG